MKKIFKFLLFTSFIFFISSTQALAVENSGTGLISTAGINEAQIISQDGNKINVSFDISNRKGVQTGVKYGIKLIKETDKGQFVVDEYVSKESLSLSENSKINKKITYIAPANISGEYTILVLIRNDSGLTLGLGVAGKVELISTIDITEIKTDTCYLSIVEEKNNRKYNLLQGVDISSDETLSLNCFVENPSQKEITVFPSYEMHHRNTYGEIVPHEGGSMDSIIFAVKEEKLVSLFLPKATKPQAYDVKVSLKSDAGDSNPVTVHYVLRGASATIQNLSLDKDYYGIGDIAKLSLFWSPSADSFPGNRAGINESETADIILVAVISNKNKKECIVPIKRIITDISNGGQVELSAPIIKKCKNPQVIITLKDANNNILDQKEFSFETKTEPIKTKTILMIFGILVVAGIVTHIINLKKKENETNI